MKANLILQETQSWAGPAELLQIGWGGQGFIFS